jgi:hypothetical protein
MQRKEEFNNSQKVANLLWANATMGIVDKQLFSSFVPTAAKLIDSYTNQGLANNAWAYAVADVDAPTLFNNHFINKCVQKKDGFGKRTLSAPSMAFVADKGEVESWITNCKINATKRSFPEFQRLQSSKTM